MSGYLPPMLLTVGVSFSNELYNTGQWDFKTLVTGGIATGLLGLLNAAMPEVATGIAWLAFTGMMLAKQGGKNSPVTNLLAVVNTNK